MYKRQPAVRGVERHPEPGDGEGGEAWTLILELVRVKQAIYRSSDLKRLEFSSILSCFFLLIRKVNLRQIYVAKKGLKDHSFELTATATEEEWAPRRG